MKRFVKTTPGGVRDLLFEECDRKREIESRLREAFRLRGYREVITPALEFYDIFSFDTSYMPMHEMYKLTDLDGRLLVLRPDITVPIARIVATHLKDAVPPIKLCYSQNVYRISPNLSGKRDEISQCGAELIGVGGMLADLEVVTAAVAALRTFCGDKFRFEIGHVGFFRELMGRLPLSGAQAEEIFEHMRAKNYAALNDILSEYKHLSAARSLMRLPRLFGGAEVLEEIKELGDEGRLRETIRYLEDIYGHMLNLGLSENVIIDLGVAPANVYYSGIVFRGYQEGAGAPVLSGGRYDTLLKEFGRDLPAVGFAIYTDEAVKSRRRGEYGEMPVGCIVHSEKGYEIKALKYADSLRDAGVPCSFSVFESLEQSVRCAAETGAEIVCVGEEIRKLAKDGTYETS